MSRLDVLLPSLCHTSYVTGSSTSEEAIARLISRSLYAGLVVADERDLQNAGTIVYFGDKSPFDHIIEPLSVTCHGHFVLQLIEDGFKMVRFRDIPTYQPDLGAKLVGVTVQPIPIVRPFDIDDRVTDWPKWKDRET